jgi:peptidoglycan/xylan/chitin deacetylase (PgdA/CDA1 family)
MFYFVKTPWLLKKCYPSCIWNGPTDQKKIYLTFDDGPHPEATVFVLDELRKHRAPATFFCIGRNVKENPGIYQRILEEGHSTGNHTHDHLNGWKVPDETYFKNVVEARKYIDSDLFRPPYGRISRFQISGLLKMKFRIVMWDILSGDFDQKITAGQCMANVAGNAGNGSIVVYHDSEKAFGKLKETLPRVLEHFSEKGFAFGKL